MERRPLSLKERQIEYLRLLKELDRFCSEHHIVYYLCAGTLLGAVRHKGFIPWDDDLDVVMPEPDFLKFYSIYKSDFYKIDSCWNNKSYRHFFPRLCNPNIVSEIGGKPYDSFGIDIYMIYGAPSTKEEQLKHINKVFRYVKLSKNIANIRDGLVRRHLWPFKSLNSSLLNWIIKKGIKEFRKFDYFECDYIWPYGGGKVNVRKELYGKPVRLQFEDGIYLSPNHYEEVLKGIYGDYMKLPPEEKRHPYHGVDYYWK